MQPVVQLDLDFDWDMTGTYVRFLATAFFSTAVCKRCGGQACCGWSGAAIEIRE